MATRAELKERAKACLKQYYWMALLVSVVASMLGAGQSGGVNFSFQTQSGSDTQYNGAGAVDHADYIAILILILSIFAVIFIIGLVVQAFLSNVVHVGLCSYFIESRKTKTDAGFTRLFYGFNSGNYLNIVKVMFLRNLFIFGWTLLLIIPGIIKTYEYAMVPYILADNPALDYSSALKQSKSMMLGHKFELFVLELSFIGWRFLGMMLCCIGIIFVLPYQNATFAEFYAELSGKNKETMQVES